MTKTKNIERDGRVIGIHVETDKESFTIPVADVRINRKMVERIQKAANIQTGSKYFRPSFSWSGYSYNMSRK